MWKMLGGILILGVALPVFSGCASKEKDETPTPTNMQEGPPQNPTPRQQPQQPPPDGKPKPVPG
jgi:hypothetical protein